uniref:Uncharacterized protein n=1 Tax=Oryza barthii TaxID=65489 RepID=A0A0D3H1E7_9ORYZ
MSPCRRRLHLATAGTSTSPLLASSSPTSPSGFISSPAPHPSPRVSVGGDVGRAPPGRGRCRRRGVEVDAPCASSSTTRSSSGRAPWRAAAAVAFTFFTQSCAVNVVYGHAWCGRVHIPVEAGAIALIGLPALELEGLPWFIKVGPGPYPAYFDLVMKQFDRLELADDVLVNSFYELEPELS